MLRLWYAMHSWNLYTYMKSQKIWPSQPFDAKVSHFQTENNGTLDHKHLTNYGLTNELNHQICSLHLVGDLDPWEAIFTIKYVLFSSKLC